MKETGTAIIIITSLMFGLKTIFLKIKNIKEIENTVLFLNQIKSMLSFYQSSPEEIINDINIDGFYLLSEIKNSILKEKTFDYSYINALNDDVFLEAKEKEYLSTLPDFLGKNDLENQILRLDMLIAKIENILIKREKELEKRKSLYITCSLSFGIAVVIILI